MPFLHNILHDDGVGQLKKTVQTQSLGCKVCWSIGKGQRSGWDYGPRMG